MGIYARRAIKIEAGLETLRVRLNVVLAMVERDGKYAMACTAKIK